MSRTCTVGELAAALQGSVLGDPDRTISGVSTPEEAGAADLIFVLPGTGVETLRRSRAGSALVPAGVDPPTQMSGIRVADPRAAMEQAIALLHPPVRRLREISPLAQVGEQVHLGADVGLGPFVCLGSRVTIGAGTEIHAGSTIGDGTTIGDACVIYAGVHVYHNVQIGNRVIIHSGAVIGADGFGYVRQAADPRPGELHRKIPQVGRVVIEDDVEIGANSTVDRATLASTRIGRGTKIDNLVTVGHNSVVGQDCIIIGQAGLSGSTVLCDGVTIAGQAGLAGHLTVGAGAVVGAQAGVTKDVPPGTTVLGSPAEDVHQARRALPLIVRLPEMRKTLLSHDRRLAKLEGSRSDCYAGEPSGPRERPIPE